MISQDWANIGPMISQNWANMDVQPELLLLTFINILVYTLHVLVLTWWNTTHFIKKKCYSSSINKDLEINYKWLRFACVWPEGWEWDTLWWPQQTTFRSVLLLPGPRGLRHLARGDLEMPNNGHAVGQHPQRGGGQVHPVPADSAQPRRQTRLLIPWLLLDRANQNLRWVSNGLQIFLINAS